MQALKPTTCRDGLILGAAESFLLLVEIQIVSGYEILNRSANKRGIREGSWESHLVSRTGSPISDSTSLTFPTELMDVSAEIMPSHVAMKNKV